MTHRRDAFRWTKQNDLQLQGFKVPLGRHALVPVSQELQGRCASHLTTTFRDGQLQSRLPLDCGFPMDLLLTTSASPCSEG